LRRRSLLPLWTETDRVGPREPPAREARIGRSFRRRSVLRDSGRRAAARVPRAPARRSPTPRGCARGRPAGRADAHASAQPTCELTHTVNRPGCSSGIRTASNRAPSGPATRYFTNGSIRSRSASTVSAGTWPAAATASAALRRTAELAATGSAAMHRGHDLARLGRRHPATSRTRSSRSPPAARACPVVPQPVSRGHSAAPGKLRCRDDPDSRTGRAGTRAEFTPRCSSSRPLTWEENVRRLALPSARRGHRARPRASRAPAGRASAASRRQFRCSMMRLYDGSSHPADPARARCDRRRIGVDIPPCPPGRRRLQRHEYPSPPPGTSPTCGLTRLVRAALRGAQQANL
jgi:hypothetical protein